MVYKFKNKYFFRSPNVDVKKIYDEIVAIGEDIKPDQILEKARDKKTELYKCFEWDDKKAAKRWRLEQAKNIIRSIVIVPDNTENTKIEYTIRAFENIGHDENQRYMKTYDIMKDAELFSQLLENIYYEIEKWENKLKTYESASENVLKAREILTKVKNDIGNIEVKEDRTKKNYA